MGQRGPDRAHGLKDVLWLLHLHNWLFFTSIRAHSQIIYLSLQSCKNPFRIVFYNTNGSGSFGFSYENPTSTRAHFTKAYEFTIRYWFFSVGFSGSCEILKKIENIFFRISEEPENPTEKNQYRFVNKLW